MSGRCLLDTNVIVALFADEAAVKSQLSAAGEVFVPSIAIGELCFGARKSMRVVENLARIDEFASDNVVLGCDTETARRYGQVKNASASKVAPYPKTMFGLRRLRFSTA